MRPIPGTLSLLLALALVVSNVALSGHLSSHMQSGPQSCLLCIHATSTGDAIVAAADALPVVHLAHEARPRYTTPSVPTTILHDHPSRAPPTAT